MKQFYAKIFTLILVCSLTTVALAQDKLIFALDLIRHGDRSPAFAMPKSTYHWPQGLGELSPKGEQQEFNLGQHMRERYITQTHLLPENYSSVAMYVRSSDYNRTLMSAQSLLYGLYPLGTGPATLPMGFQPIPIHTVPKEIDDLLLTNHNKAQHDEILEKYVFTQPEWRAKTIALQAKFPHWSEATGMKITNLQEVLYAADNLRISQLYNVPIPAGLSEQDQQEIIAAGSWAFLEEMKVPQIWHLTAKHLLATIVHYLQSATEHTTSLKFVLFSAHDDTIMTLLSALQTPATEWPPYASDLNFSLYENPAHNFYVKLTFNNQPVTVPACGGDTCSLAQLDKLIEEQ
ncbi:MAG: histidine phosphatase family protein [Pseudomonadota bacterium]